MNTLYLIAICLAVGFGGGFGTASYFDKLEIQAKENALTEIHTKAKADLDLANAELLAKDAAALLLKNHIDNASVQDANIIASYAERVRVYSNSHRGCKNPAATPAMPGNPVSSGSVPETRDVGIESLELTPSVLDAIRIAKAGVAFAVANCGIK